MATTKNIHALLNTQTGETAPRHVIGTDEKGRTLVQYVEGWEPVDAAGQVVDCEQDYDGNWIDS